MLGLNLSRNQINTSDIKKFLESISSNRALHSILFTGNPGFSQEIALFVSDITTRNESRLHHLPLNVHLLLRRWIGLQLHDAESTDAIVQHFEVRPPETETEGKLVNGDPLNISLNNYSLNGLEHGADSVLFEDVSEVANKNLFEFAIPLPNSDNYSIENALYQGDVSNDKYYNWLEDNESYHR